MRGSMRRNILHVGAQNLKYEIREIVGEAREIEALGQEITWENIGDPVEKGESPPKWIREIVADLVDQAGSWAYCDSQGVPAAREFLADDINRRDGVQVTADDIVFFNGLGDAVAKVYGFLVGRPESWALRRPIARTPPPKPHTLAMNM
jgi:aspartate/methionine/tyrosine aminotransferase